jgi:hypothetical protein
VSRTDAHAPFLVRIARGDVFARPRHDHRSSACDLPDRSALAAGRAHYMWARSSHCRWDFVYTGFGVCNCSLCYDHAALRRRRRNERRNLRQVQASAAKRRDYEAI